MNLCYIPRYEEHCCRTCKRNLPPRRPISARNKNKVDTNDVSNSLTVSTQSEKKTTSFFHHQPIIYIPHRSIKKKKNFLNIQFETTTYYNGHLQCPSGKVTLVDPFLDQIEVSECGDSRTNRLWFLFNVIPNLLRISCCKHLPSSRPVIGVSFPFHSIIFHATCKYERLNDSIRFLLAYTTSSTCCQYHRV